MTETPYARRIVESTPLFMLPGRRCENGRPAPIDSGSIT